MKGSLELFDYVMLGKVRSQEQGVPVNRLIQSVKHLKSIKIIYIQHTNLIILNWKDCFEVILLSNCFIRPKMFEKRPNIFRFLRVSILVQPVNS